MTTPRIHFLVSLAAVAMMTVTMSACATAPSRLGHDDESVAALPAVIRFNNDARDYVHVYLIGERREWFLGRVEAGAHTTLRIPREALEEAPGMVNLAVLPGGRMTLSASGQVGATKAIQTPLSDIIAQRWTFTQLASRGELTTLRLAP